MTNRVLSIAIPTYNRAELIDISLQHHVPIACKFNIPIIIRDNNSTDHTEQLVANWKEIYPLIEYKKNELNLGPDRNFELVLLDSNSEYVWLLGDTYKITEEQIKFILDTVLSTKPDFFVFNFKKRVEDIPSKIYSDCNNVLKDLGWHMTIMSSLVYSKDVLLNANFKRYRNTNFIHLGIIFEYISQNKFDLIWISELYVSSLVEDNSKKSCWEDATFDTWVYCWLNFVLSLPPNYDLNTKFKVISEHNAKTNIFSLKRLLYLRMMNILNVSIYLMHLNFFRYTLPHNRIILLLICSLPKSILKKLYFFFKYDDFKE